MRKILITNDDGINSDGIARLAKAAQEFGEVWVVAPDSQRSAMSHSLTLRHRLEVWKADFPVDGVHAYACDGTPADCVRIGTLNIVPEGADLVLSGINYGFNVASDLQYSATAGAALEAAFQGIHTIAFSEEAVEDHSVTDRYLAEVLGKLIDQPLGFWEIWNVNFPGCKAEECKGILWNRTVSRDQFYLDSYEETKLAEDRSAFMVQGLRKYKSKEGTDLHAVLNGAVSVGKVRNLS